MKQLNTMSKNHKEETGELAKVREILEGFTKKAINACKESNRIMESVEVSEAFMRSYMEMVTESEMITKTKYKRSVCAGDICKEAANSSVLALQAVLTIPQRVYRLNCAGPEKSADQANDHMNDDRAGNRGDVGVLVSDLLSRVRHMGRDLA